MRSDAAVNLYMWARRNISSTANPEVKNAP